MTPSSFVVPLKKWGNSYVLKVPPEVAKQYPLDTTFKVTLEPTHKCKHCDDAGLYPVSGGYVCIKCWDEHGYEPLQ